MIQRPVYFEAVRDNASKRWNQLESDPELAGPWHQLFKQVQSPRHILSELLQNADDAGATEAAVSVEDRLFRFTHNGDDFTAEHFASLCRFGYSNKRTLHTIGFRGIGFKSTFSLGDTVELYTPSLAVAFNRKRFTEPIWLEQGDSEPHTRIQVAIADANRKQEVEKNLREWLASPISLLFFKNIRRLRIGTKDMHWGSLGPGPVPSSEWIALYDNPDDARLIVRSTPEAFPPEALEEIRQERLLSADQDMDFPPSRIEIVLGAKGRLFVVLPTGVETDLPFACNAPFIQDPARVEIKDPATSPTNRWLLERAGELAASTMAAWLGEHSANEEDRARAYALLPDVDRDATDLKGSCGALVELAFADRLEGCPCLLVEGGDVALSEQGVVIPSEVLEVWPSPQASSLLDKHKRPPLSRHIVSDHIDKLANWGLVERISKADLIATLLAQHLPVPKEWRRLLKLWTYLAPEFSGYEYYSNKKDIRLMPVQGKEVLYSANEVVRLGERRLLQSDEDWEFLSEHLLVANQNWLRFLTEQRRITEEKNEKDARKEVEAASSILKQVGLEETSDFNKIVEQVASEFFAQKPIALPKCVQLSQIAAKLGAAAGTSMRFATRSLGLRSPDFAILYDRSGRLTDLFSSAWCDNHILHSDYSKAFVSCTEEDWNRWVSQGRSRLLLFAPLVQKRQHVHGRFSVEKELARRGALENPSYSYVTDHFVVDDWDFDDELWRHWANLAKESQSLWAEVAERIVSQNQEYWSRSRSAKISQVATTGSIRSISSEALLPNWILRLRELECLRDTRGFHRKPGDLLVRTPATESLMDVEPFVDAILDREATRPLLLLLGARDKPTGPAGLLDRLRALSHAERPPVHEVEKWYLRIDQIIDNCSTADVAAIKKAFSSEKIVLTDLGQWSVASGVFLSADNDVPGTALIRPGVRDLTLWRKVGVAEHPTVELAIEWLKTQPEGRSLSEDDARRIRALVRRHPARIWDETGHWLNLSREWVPTYTLAYSRTMQSLVPYAHLHEWVRQKTADFQDLSVDVQSTPPFSDLPSLGSKIEEVLQTESLFKGEAVSQAWLLQFAQDLGRAQFDDDAETSRVGALAQRLAETKLQTTPDLRIVPYISGTPAGTPRRTEVAWFERTLYVEDLPKAKLAKLVPDRLGKVFDRTDVAAALNYCFGRSREDVREYMSENFALTEAPVEQQHPLEEEPGSLPDPAPNPTGEADSETPEPEIEIEGETEPDGDLFEPDVEGGTPLPPPPDLPPRRPTPRPEKPSILERFSRANGFKKDGNDRFYHSDGSWIGRLSESAFPWGRHSANGDLICSYLPREHCLELEPLQIGADIWGLLEKFPTTYALILDTLDGIPVAISGARVQELHTTGKLKLYPATYRLAYADNEA